MASADETIEGLRTAVRISPENLPLRQALAEVLAANGRYEEAEKEYKAAVGLAPSDGGVKLALAGIYYLQDKNSHAMVIVEDLIKSAGNAKALLLHAKLLLARGDGLYAEARQYKRAVEADPAVRDETLATKLGISGAREDSGGDAFDGKLRAAAGEPEEGRANGGS